MAGFNYSQNIIGFNKVKGDIHELEVDVSQLSASVLTIGEKVDELSEKAIGSISEYSQITGGTVDRDSLIKVGNTVFASARLYNINESSVGYFFEIPSDYRPKTKQYVMAYTVVDSAFIPIQAEVNTNGLVMISYSQSVNTTQVGFAGSWTLN